MEAAKERMIESNLRLVVTIAKQFANRGVALQDLIQEGTLGLIHAVERYRGDNPSRAKFASYAAWWIKLKVSRAVGEGRTIRLPARLPALIAEASRARDAFELENDRQPTDSELAALLGVSQNRLRLVLQSSKPLLSLDQQLSTARQLDDSRRVLDLLPDDEDERPMVQLEASLQRQALADTLGLFLSPEEQNVLERAFGLDRWDGERRSHADVAKELDVKVSYVARVEERALRKLRARRGLSDLLAARGFTTQ